MENNKNGNTMHDNQETTQEVIQVESDLALNAESDLVKAAKSNEKSSEEIEIGDDLSIETLKKYAGMNETERERSVERIKNSTLGYVQGENAPKEELFAELKRRIILYHPSNDLSLIEKAYRVADEAHGDKKRKSGQPYVTHPLHVALILADLRMDKETIASGLLHDVIEDCPGYGYTYIEREFGKEIADIVDGVTKVQKDGEVGQVLADAKDKAKDKAKIEARIAQHAETYRKMLISSGKNPRVLYVKIADRLHNMRTLDAMSPEKQRAIALETINIYSSIAEKLGISKIKVELDDYSLKYLDPVSYNSIKEKVNQRLGERMDYINQIIDIIKKSLEERQIEATVTGRVKHFYSIHKKLKKREFDQIYDLFAVRVITKDIANAYYVTGVIPQLFTVIPDRHKDYIARKKPNGYQSIHDTYFGPDNHFFEVQVRTEEMHREANYGKAAHWVYKERGDGAVASEDEIRKKVWLEQLTEAVQEEDDNDKFLERAQEILSIDNEKVIFYAATDRFVKELPVGSTVVDYAYTIHTAFGHRIGGAKVFDRIVPLSYVIQPYDVVEIIESKNPTGPKRDWLKFVYLSSTKNKIKSWFNKQNKEENIKKGHDMLVKQCKDEGEDLGLLDNPKYQEKAMAKLYCDAWEKVLANIALEAIKPGKIINWLKDARKVIDPKFMETNEELMKRINTKKNHDTIKKNLGNFEVPIEGVDEKALCFPKCCSAIPGDHVKGYISRGRGYIVHRAECINIIKMEESDPDRVQDLVLLNNGKKRMTFAASLQVMAYNRIGVGMKVLEKLAKKNINASNLDSKEIDHKTIARFIFDVDVYDKVHLNELMKEIKDVPQVISVERIHRG